MSLTRNQRKAQTRENLLVAARGCFEATGYVATGVADVAKAAGVAHGTLYVHFKNKEALLDALLDVFNQRVADEVTDAIAAVTVDRQPRQLVRAAGEAFLDTWHSERGMVPAYVSRMTTYESASVEALRDGVNPPVYGLLLRILQLEAARRGRHDAHLGLIAQGLLSMWLRIGLQALFNPEVTRTAALETLTDLTLGGLDQALSPSGSTP